MAKRGFSSQQALGCGVVSEFHSTNTIPRRVLGRHLTAGSHIVGRCSEYDSGYSTRGGVAMPCMFWVRIRVLVLILDLEGVLGKSWRAGPHPGVYIPRGCISGTGSRYRRNDIHTPYPRDRVPGLSVAGRWLFLLVHQYRSFASFASDFCRSTVDKYRV